MSAYLEATRRRVLKETGRLRLIVVRSKGAGEDRLCRVRNVATEGGSGGISMFIPIILSPDRLGG